MNPSPFSLDTQFLPDDAGEDKIDLDLGKWRVFGLTPGDGVVDEFKSYLSSPPEDDADFAWESSAFRVARLCMELFFAAYLGKKTGSSGYGNRHSFTPLIHAALNRLFAPASAVSGWIANACPSREIAFIAPSCASPSISNDSSGISPV